MDKELIEQIKNTLQNHEESYPHGAWERFTKKENKNKSFNFWPLFVAASILIAFGTLTYFGKPAKEQKFGRSDNKSITPQNGKMKGDQEVKQSDAIATKISDVRNGYAVKKVGKKNSLMNYSALAVLMKSNNPNKLKVITQIPSSVTDIFNISKNFVESITATALNNPKISTKELHIDNKSSADIKTAFQDILAKVSDSALQLKGTPNFKAKRWGQAIFVAPSMGSDSKLNMNYGFSINYQLANRVTIGSGIAYTALSSKSELGKSSDQTENSASHARALPTNTTDLESVDASIKGINIPLDLKYKITEKIYAGLGISAFAIVNKKQQNNYLVTKTINANVVNTFGLSDQKMLVKTDRISAEQNEINAIGNDFIGFYNLSFGYTQKINKKNIVAVEPFVSLPMKSFSKENLNLSNGGLRLKFQF